jgi:hypothetical protein
MKWSPRSRTSLLIVVHTLATYNSPMYVGVQAEVPLLCRPLLLMCGLCAMTCSDFQGHMLVADCVCAQLLLLQVPIALVSLVDTPVQWFKSAQGLGDVDRTPRNTSFCAWWVDTFVTCSQRPLSSAAASPAAGRLRDRVHQYVSCTSSGLFRWQLYVRSSATRF